MYCRNCGTRLPENARFCLECGTVVILGKMPANRTPMPKVNPKQGRDMTHCFDPKDIAKNKKKCYLCYLSMLALIPAFTTAEDSKLVRFHANQGLVLGITELICLVFMVLVRLFVESFAESAFYIIMAIPVLLGFVAAIVIGSIAVIFATVGMTKLCLGISYKLPFFGRFDILGRFYK